MKEFRELEDFMSKKFKEIDSIADQRDGQRTAD